MYADGEGRNAKQTGIRQCQGNAEVTEESDGPAKVADAYVEGYARKEEEKSKEAASEWANLMAKCGVRCCVVT